MNERFGFRVTTDKGSLLIGPYGTREFAFAGSQNLKTKIKNSDHIGPVVRY